MFLLAQTVMRQTAVAFASDSWLEVSLDSVQEVLRMECLNVSELEVVAALMRWGRAQLEEAHVEEEFGEKLRRKIESCLKLIRLPVLSHLEFTELCSHELGKVFSSKERYRVLECITLKKWDTLPAPIASTVSTRRTRPTVAIKAPFVEDKLLVLNAKELKTSFSFHVDTKANFVGFLSLPPVHETKFNANAFTRFHVVVSEKESGTEILREYFSNEREPLMFENACKLDANVKYCITFSLNYPYEGLFYYSYNLDASKNPVSNDWINVTFSGNVLFKLNEMIFEIPGEANTP